MAQGASATGSYRYTVLVIHEEDGWVAHIPAIGIATQGDDVNHTFEMAQEAIEGWLEVALGLGMEIPIEHEPHVRQIEAHTAVAS
jgi:predicted RNase H-like HicB family nuclease